MFFKLTGIRGNGGIQKVYSSHQVLHLSGFVNFLIISNITLYQFIMVLRSDMSSKILSVKYRVGKLNKFFSLVINKLYRSKCKNVWSTDFLQNK